MDWQPISTAADVQHVTRTHPWPESIPASVMVHGVHYVGNLYPESENMITMSEDAFNKLISDAKEAGVDVTTGKEYRERYS